MAKAQFESHAASCARCSQYDGHTAALRLLCLEGVVLFKRILDCEEKMVRARQRADYDA